MNVWISTGPTASANPGNAARGYCGHCGEPADGGADPSSGVHLHCGEHLAMEPARYCAACRRRMKVQVTPLGWSAECSRHGVLVQ